VALSQILVSVATSSVLGSVDMLVDMDNSPMRINLSTPFSEKDAVKALGARWDGTKKVWYITDVADLTPFMRWIPNLEAASEPLGGAIKPVTKASESQSPGVITKSTLVVPHCGCEVLPWEDCQHSIAQTAS
jgi:hypothetical protein